ncbi:probable pectinesterase/pectinesterase inhibitor 41 [Eucalyptus grandis]|uniref:probable pectinesterase/pectinesterase inhibitor 41 n=1 Tax=Eucalyptus grandis TaxID=71139 RepID=UPI00192F08E9|nr:probable pectinesterase/pectinesterase inhibitor 41 [Eucalyptus grandis]
MASSPILVLLPLLLVLPFLASLGFADANVASTSLVSTGTICNSTPYPSICRSNLPSNDTGDIYYYGRAAMHKSLLQARKFLALVDKYLTRQASLTISTVRALEDCHLLASLNVEFLLNSFQAVNATSSALPMLKADDVQTLLSAILTNGMTCLDGLQSTASAWSVKNSLSVPLANDTKLYSVSLALYTRAWVPTKKKKGKGSAGAWQPKSRQLPFQNGHMSFMMSSRTRQIYDSVTRRTLLQSSEDDPVMVSDIVVVSQDGTWNFTTINDAVMAAPNNTDGTNGYFLIYVTAGVYEEYVSIANNKRYLMMIGDGINQTVITGNRSVADGWTTFSSATFAVVAPNFVAVNITFRNTAGAQKFQAVAVRSAADLSVFFSCSFEAYQDTLYTHSLRQFYRECDVYGTVDFIFGNAAVVFQNCNLYPRLPISGQSNMITAQGRTDVNQNTGTSIHNCTIRAADDLASSNTSVQTYLGRPWKQYSRTVYMQSFMDSLINPAGWQIWDGDFALATLYYAEYNNTGPGSNTTNRVTWPGYHVINATDAANFTVSSFLLGDNWLPQTGVPYTSELI